MARGPEGTDTDAVGLDQLDADGEPPEFDLTPRSSAAGSPRRNARGHRWMAVGVLVVIAAATGFLVTKALGSATDYFYQVDEAVAHRGDLGTRRFRIQGTVANSPKGTTLDNNTQRISFDLVANGVTAPVTYTGSDPPALFKRCEPVVIVGHWGSAASGSHFIGDQIIIKHSETYTAEHQARLKSDPACH